MRERDVAGRAGGFIAEGEVVLRALAQSRLHKAVSLLIAAPRVERLAGLIEAFPREVPLYAATRAVMDEIVGFPIHRGVLAFGERGPDPGAAALLAALHGPALALALFGVSNHDNVGGAMRNAAAFGASAVLIDPATCDPLYRKAIRVSAGTALLIPFARLRPSEDALALLARHGFEAIALSPVGGRPIAELERPERACLLAGAEGRGLSREILERVPAVRIPMAEGVDSLNVATATGIALHHLAALSPAPRLG